MNDKTEAKSDKFGSRSRKCVFLGYPFGKKGWKLYDLETKECFVSRDVQFVESVFPFAMVDSPVIDSEQIDVGISVSNEDDDLFAFTPSLSLHDSHQERLPEPSLDPGHDKATAAGDGQASRDSMMPGTSEVPSKPSLGHDGTITTSHVSTNSQLAYIFTKNLGTNKFDYFLDKLGIHNLHAPT
ncbi:hypothetical protein LIER_20472 [Lithospermum erythrorhizon]|uniref:Retroviral polymerase SH3-like domain-containing protein n=1 Tax=Lithospermum erythrorhizon TaxID=34254 RepID=A0AAV3QS95_LITER